MLGTLCAAIIGYAAFSGAGAGVAYAIANRVYNKQRDRNQAEVIKVLGTPCYINEGVVMGTQLQRASVLIVKNETADETLRVSFMETDLVFTESPVGLCGSPKVFWVLDGYASTILDEVVSSNLTRPERYIGHGVAFGGIVFLGLVVVIGLVVLLCCGCDPSYFFESSCILFCIDRSYWRWTRERVRLHAAPFSTVSAAPRVEVSMCAPVALELAPVAPEPAEELPEPGAAKNEIV